ncbi:cytochrome P450 [Cognatishimia sp. 1_MG-2023]|uniref:cytochrome P450 n=1 Tax=Cognatishimia sp. 1_MG-2023 TaxID=3062642 RepID=UPI0026E3F44B|nr:cytochrome P450 [Cognatishimia sp. 1_MG-2023]MDO6727792.1 cytochrome P450 [Cognatishimia sp. 1_MG-2023]
MLDRPALPVHPDLHKVPLGLLASLKAARNNLLEILPYIAVKQPMVSGKTGLRWHMVMDPEAIRRMLLENLDNYPKSNATKNLLKPAIGNSMFVAEGAEWRWQRRAAAPVFSHRNVTALGPVMSLAAQDCCDRLAHGGKGAVNMMDEMVRTTFDVIAEVTFSGEGSFDAASVHNAIDAYIAEAGKISLLDMIGAPDWIPRPGRLMSGSAVRDMRRVADTAITERKARGARDIPDLLDLLLEGVDPETKRSMNTAELRDNLLTFIVAGHETTALSLSWALYLLAFDPAIQDRARAEVQSVLQGRAATGEDVANLPFVRCIIDEALRMYPPAAIVSRTALAADTLCGRDIHPGDTVMIPIYALHRHEMLWDDPDAFRPDRFADRKAIDRYAYLPFGDGPRICIGASFAIQEAVIILATLLAQFKFHAVPGKDPDPVMILTLRPEGGVWLQAEPI